MAESLATITTSVVTGGTNNHSTVAEEMNVFSTDFVQPGVVGTIVANTGSGGTGSFCVNADSSPDMGVTVLAGQAYIACTPSSQDPQVLRARATANSTSYTINANSSGSTKYDWIYLNCSATNANVPDAGADNVTALYTSRSTSNTSDTGSPPTYGLVLAVVTVANGASSITNSNILDSRANAILNISGGGIISPKGLDTSAPSSWTWQAYTPTFTSFTIGNGTVTAVYTQIGKTVHCRGVVNLGSTSSVSGLIVSLPVTSSSTEYVAPSGNPVDKLGIGTYYKVGTGSYSLDYTWTSTTTATAYALNATGSFLSYSGINSGIPNTWASGDYFSWNLTYEAAS